MRLRDANGHVVEARDEIQYVGRTLMAAAEPQLAEESSVDMVVAGAIPAEGLTEEQPEGSAY